MNVVKEYAVRDLRYLLLHEFVQTIYKVENCNTDRDCMMKSNSVIL